MYMCTIILSRVIKSYIFDCLFGVSIVFVDDFCISVVINGGGKDWAIIFGGARGNGCWIILFGLTVISNLSVKLSCCSICMLCSCMSLWVSCLYCNLFSAHLCNLLRSWCWLNNGGGATKVFQSNRWGTLLDECSRYRASRFVGNFKGNSVGDIWLREGVEGSDTVSCNDEVVSDETSIGTLTKFVSPWVKVCVIQYGRRSVVAGGLKGFFSNLFWCGSLT